MVTRKKRISILLYSHNPDYVDRYYNVIKKAKKGIQIFACKNKKEIEKYIRNADIIFSGHTFPVEYLGAAKQLRWIQSMSAGVENFVVATSLPPDVIITRIEGVFGPIMAEYVIGYMLAITQNMKVVFENQRRRAWQPFVVDSLCHKTVGIMGLGSIGAYIAYKVHLLGAEVVGFDEQIKRLPYIKSEYSSLELKEFLSKSDFVVVTMPLTHSTRGIIGEKELDAMKRTAYLINISRGAVVRERDLIEALKQRKIAGAILDVFEEEPLPESHEYWLLDNLIITPHIAGPSIPEDIAPFFIENLKRFEENKPLRGIVDRTRGF